MSGRIWPRRQPDGSYLVLYHVRPGKWRKCGKIYRTDEGWYSEPLGRTFDRKSEAARATAEGAGGPGPRPPPSEPAPSPSEAPYAVGTRLRGGGYAGPCVRCKQRGRRWWVGVEVMKGRARVYDWEENWVEDDHRAAED